MDLPLLDIRDAAVGGRGAEEGGPQTGADQAAIDIYNSCGDTPRFLLLICRIVSGWVGGRYQIPRHPRYVCIYTSCTVARHLSVYRLGVSLITVLCCVSLSIYVCNNLGK